MWLKFLTIILAFFMLALLQQSFFPYFNIVGITPNIAFILFFILIFFERPGDYYSGIVTSVVAGLATDLFSSLYIGPGIVSLFLIYILVKTIHYFLKESRDSFAIFYFIPLFLCSFALYNLLYYVLTYAPNLPLHFFLIYNWQSIVIIFAYNFLVSFLGFYTYISITARRTLTRQLTLFR